MFVFSVAKERAKRTSSGQPLERIQADSERDRWFTAEEAKAQVASKADNAVVQGIVADYSDDAILVVQKKVYRGKDGARQVFTQLLADVPQAQWELETVYADDVLYLEWNATGGGRKIEGAIDTFIFQDGMIRVQTVVYTVQQA